MNSDEQQILKALREIPGIGKSCALDLLRIGIRKVSDLRDQDPCRLYGRLNAITGATHDICMLYTFRCAVYYASEKHHEKKKLNWWYWKDKTVGSEKPSS